MFFCSSTNFFVFCFMEAWVDCSEEREVWRDWIVVEVC